MNKNHLKIWFIALILLVGLLVGCSDKVEPVENNDAKIEEVINAIDVLSDDITKDDIEDVKATESMYLALDDADRSKVTNYEVLEAALKKVDYLQNIDSVLLAEFSKVEAMLNEAIPDFIASLTSKIDLPTIYTYQDEYQTVNYRISYTSLKPDLISNIGVVNHPRQETTVKLNMIVRCGYNNLERIFEKEIRVERNLSYMFDHSICVAYWYGRYQELTDIDYETIDIINYSFAQVAYDGANWYIDGRLDNLKSFAPIKEKGIKLCLSLGGWHDDKSFWNTYALAAKTDEARKAVAKAILDVMIEYDLDGVDMDWEYPTSSDKTNFTLLMMQIKETLKAYNPNYLITAAIPAGSWIGSQFDLKGLNSALDLFYIMSYDLDDGMNCNHLSSLGDAKDSVEFFSKSGVDKEKLVIGSAFYGRVYEGISDNGKGGLGQKATKKNSISYTKIKEDYLSRIGNGVTKLYDEKEEAYYLYDSENKQFITYEDIESVTEKWEYVMESGIGGLMYWSYNNDTTNTLMKAIHDAQNK